MKKKLAYAALFCLLGGCEQAPSEMEEVEKMVGEMEEVSEWSVPEEGVIADGNGQEALVEESLK